MKWFTLVMLMLTTISCQGQKAHKEEGTVNKLKEMGTPVFWAEGHPGRLSREDWKIEVTGACNKPQVFSWQDLLAMPKTTADARLTSVTRWSVQGVWGGVKLSDILEAVEVSPEVKFVRFWSYGMDYDTSIPIKIANMERTLLAWEFDGEFLTEDYGGPVRVFCPYLWGYKSAKSVVKIELMKYYIPGFWEKRGYTDSGKIEAGPVRDINDKAKIKQIPDGEVRRFLDE